MNDRKIVKNPKDHESVIDAAINRAAARYIADREDKIDDFVRKHYSFRGTLRIHAHAIGLDIIRVPLNIIWSLFNIFLVLIGFIAKRSGAHRLHHLIQKIPPGLETDMDKQISWLILTELLELPYQQGNRQSRKDALMKEITRDPDLQQLIEDEMDNLADLNANPAFRQELDSKLAEYGSTRTGASELASNTVLLVTSKIALGKASFGALSAGVAVSVSVAQSLAASNFWLGSTLGAYYYAIMPATASIRLIVAMTVLVAVILALLSTFIGILTDPLQARLGLHQRRLRKLLRAVEQDLLVDSDSTFHLREKYFARIFDIIDFLDTVRRST